MLASGELHELAEDIRAHGLRTPVVLCGGKVLDGRNRLLACERAGVKPAFGYYDDGDPVGYVVSLNLHRRHLNESQRGMVAGRIAKLRLGDNQHSKEGGQICPPSTTDAADQLHVSPRTVKSARRVIEHGAPELQQAVDAGEIAVSAAGDVATLPEDEQRELVSQGKKAVQQKAKELREAKRAPKDEPPPDPVGGDAPPAQTQPEIGEVTDGETDEDCEDEDCRHGYEFDDPEYALMAMSACIDRFMRMWPRSGEEFMADLLASCRRAEQFFGLDQEASNGTD